ncbi:MULTISPECIES: hypothetical protein [Leuconostoc]|uniref:Uncharacterized protein n=2 Tax=Leuconostoc kimchii TaxID=136609 RepID=D5T327_LEUKI|nr:MULTISPECIES: hypothetical protein [Leuconostoc]ADG40676.1 hypothetical protein LKI_05675 [Leuconostoc kimchii IMSNU 11154]AEJ31347.1 hypothetical protein LGMK_06465 [Leuconostoc sp. C2]QBR47129.1 hypothetical protein EW139_02945 [Leuconostoc kimchii]
MKRSTYYYLETHPISTSSDDKLAVVIRQIKSPQFQTEYGYRRVTILLHDQGFHYQTPSNKKAMVCR